MPIQLCLPTHAAADDVECWAVIVGVAEYKHYSDLSYSDDDAQELASQLSSVWGDDHINLLTNSSATKLAIQNAITDWLASRADANDVALFYFSGYGETNYSWIAPHDAGYASTWLKSSELNACLNALDSEKVVVILDTYRSGRFETTLSNSGRVILMSSSSSEDSWQYNDLKHSVFTYYILEALSNFDTADTNNDLELSAEEIFYYAQSETEDWEDGNQHPQMSDQYSGQLSLLVQFIFNSEPNLPPRSEALILDNEHLSTPIELIWAPGSVHDITLITPVDTGKGTRYVFISWDDGNTSTSRTISGGGVYTANYQTQHELVIESAFGEPKGQGWYDEGSTANISVTSVEGPTTRYIFTGWSGDYSGTEATASVTMDSPKTITVDWRTDYLLTIESEHGQPEGEGWYESGSTATISAPSSTGVGIRHIFTGWSGDYSSTEATASVTMNSPKTITADWRTDFTQLYIFIGAVLVAGGAALAVLMIRRRKKAAAPAMMVESFTQPYQPPQPSQPPTVKFCANCGAEIKPGDAFCTKCGKAVND
jgi:hypothetical protein